MQILKPLNKNNLIIILIISCFIILDSKSEEEVIDIWKLEPKKIITGNSEINDANKSNQKTIYESQIKKNNNLEIKEDIDLISKKVEIDGLYDPSQNDLQIDMWSNSDGNEILNIYKRINKIDISDDAREILNISLLTNSYYPQKNITKDQFLNLKVNWLIKNRNFRLIEEFLLKNKNVKQNTKLVRFLVDDYLSKSELEKACNFFSKITEAIEDDYLFKFNIYCLINLDKKDEAQLKFDIKTELGWIDDSFNERFNYLMGYVSEANSNIPEKTILDFHLAHRTIIDFNFEPDKSTSPEIWKYLSTSNLLGDLNNVDIADQNKIAIIEKATHDRNYSEKKLYDLYKRFQFNINQLLTIKETYKLLPNIESRALLYQGILINTKSETKLELAKILKDSFINDKIADAFKDELKKIITSIDISEVPSDYIEFYENFKDNQIINLTKIKINNKIIHQSKLLNYFLKDESMKVVEKDLNDLLKKTKKNKKYTYSTKDIILIESLKSDGIKVLKKYNDIYEINKNNMPADIQSYISNGEIGLVLLRLVEVIGQDELENIDAESLYFIISALNQLNINTLRNKILLKILPLKV